MESQQPNCNSTASDGTSSEDKSGEISFASRTCARSTGASSQPPAKRAKSYETEDAQDRYPFNAAVCNGHVDDIQEAGTKAQPLPPQLSLTDIEPEMARPDAGHGLTETDGNRPHLRHAETTSTALERPAYSPPTSAWSVAYGSIAQSLANQRLEHQHILAAPASTVLTALSHSPTALAS
ncbi:hypothetical protein SprV_0702448200 [Sparganum proliferum]